MTKKLEIRPVQIITASFASIIFAGAILLMLPAAIAFRGSSISFIDAFFTATSAVCVTGLTVKDTAFYFSFLGKTIILSLIQIGGLGIMVFSTLFLVMLGRKFSLSRKKIIAADAVFELSGPRHFRRFILFIVTGTLLIEGIATVALYIRWRPLVPGPAIETAWISFFHCVSAFCNAGFSLFSDNLMGFRGDYYTNAVIAGLIIAGGLGFMTLRDIIKAFMRMPRKRFFSSLSVHTRLVVIVTVILIVVGAVAIWFLESNDAFAHFRFSEKLCASYFQSVSARTAGFNTVDIGALRNETNFFIMGLMFIGASSGGTGGGVKTTTIGILLVFLIALLRNRPQAILFKRAISRHTFYKAACIFAVALVWNAVAIFLLMLTERHSGIQGDYLLRCAFEVFSAFGTVGLSTGITPLLSPWGKLIIIATMFMGRIGPLGLALSIASEDHTSMIRYPKEKIAVG